MKLDYPKIRGNRPVWKNLTPDQRKAITAIPTVVKSFTLDEVSFQSLLGGEMDFHLIYRSSLCGLPTLRVNDWLYHPAVFMSTRTNTWKEGYHEITWVILHISHEQDCAQYDLDAIPALRMYNKRTIKGYVRAVDKMARLLGWVPEVKP